jgi:hypothetical protein
LRPRDESVEGCAAAQHEKERMLQYAKYCSNACNRRLIVETIKDKLKELDGARPGQQSQATMRTN